ncbi:uncharacterized protein si:ch211-157b11.14 isoform X2 [Oryzias melastigma]|uniref:uncharacterized protein si:ch211-157b11.14 isoform X2 n=1 Tax=Oryzias melastigma TaxID=30732 RepID=UPI000CF7B6F6|nr:uncharacterized protein si:ch211-157b11.14 isoform X2 [Oryzias melastigma]
MDDLDHSIHIAENDWSSFCDESEECDLPQASLAYPDDCSLSDAEDSGSSTSAAAQQQTQRSPDANSDGRESNTPELPDTSGRVGDVATSVKQVEIGGGDAISAEGMDSKGTTKTRTGAQQADAINNQSSGEAKEFSKDGNLQTKSDQNSSEEVDSTPCNQELQNLNEADAAEAKAEKDRWFVTVNENPSRQRGRSSSLKKKRQLKSTNEGSRVQEGSTGNDADQEKEMESNAVKDTESQQSKSLGNKQNNEILEETTNECTPASTRMEHCHDFEELSSPEPDQSREVYSLQDLCKENQSSLRLTSDRHKSTDQTKEGHNHCFDRSSSAAQETSESAGESSTCTKNTNSGTLSPTPAPVSVADCPETYARAEGNTRPVYAISAFWDDMEKLTINDILHLRMGTSRSPRHDELTDAGDTADSDYFTQSEESKPEQSGCEFSTSDFEEEYWQFVGASGNASPDPDSKTQPSCSCSDDDTISEGGATPVPLEEPAGQLFDSQKTLFMGPQPMKRSKSLFNMDGLEYEASSLLSLLDGDSLPRCVFQNLEDNNDLTLKRPVCSSLFCMDVPATHQHASFSDKFQYFFTETEVNVACVQLCDPEDVSVTPIFTCSAFMEHLPQTSVQGFRENPIPIFSFSHPTVRHLTFPEHHYATMNSDCEELDKISIAPFSFLQSAGPHGGSGAAASGGSCCWKSLQSLRRISFLDKGSIWCGRSGVWTFPFETENTAAAPGEGRAFLVSPEVFRRVEEPQKVMQWTTTLWVSLAGGGDCSRMNK